MKTSVLALCAATLASALSLLASCGSDASGGTVATPPAQPGQAGDGPNLRVDADALAYSIQFDTQDFPATDCAVIEGCVSGTGTRRLLRFAADIVNAGNRDLVLGDPTTNPNFKFSPCHGHYHLQNMMEYELLDPGTGHIVSSGTTPVVARKQGFCLEDSAPYVPGTSDPTESSGGKYDCTNQGLSVGWEDIYDASIDCQWLDITGVAPGAYILRLTVNPDRVYPDTNLSDNTAETPVVID